MSQPRKKISLVSASFNLQRVNSNGEIDEFLNSYRRSKVVSLCLCDELDYEYYG